MAHVKMGGISAISEKEKHIKIGFNLEKQIDH